MTLPLEHALLFAGVLFSIGFVGVVARRNLIFILLSIEIMLNAAAYAFVAVSGYLNEADGQVMFVVILSMAAAEVAVALALLIRYERRYQTLDVDAAQRMKG